MMNIVFSASVLPYFVTKTSASYVSRSELIQAYLRQEQRTSIRKVPFDQKFHHFLIVLRRWASATPNARTARTYTVWKITTTIILCVCLECTTCIFVFYVVILQQKIQKYSKIIHLYGMGLTRYCDLGPKKIKLRILICWPKKFNGQDTALEIFSSSYFKIRDSS